MAGRQHQQEFLGEEEGAFEAGAEHVHVERGRRPFGGVGDHGAIEPVRQQGIDQGLRGAGLDFDLHIRPLAVVTRQWPGQPAGRRALHAAHPQLAGGNVAAHGLPGFLGQGQQLLGVSEEALAFGRQRHALAVAQEQRYTQFLLELLDARGHIGLHAVQAPGGTGDALLKRHGSENLKFGQIHGNPLVDRDFFVLKRRTYCLLLSFIRMNKSRKSYTRQGGAGTADKVE